MTIEIVERFQTADGQLFESEEQARRHERDLLCQRVNALLDEFVPMAHRPSTYKVVTDIETRPEEFADYLQKIVNVLP